MFICLVCALIVNVGTTGCNEGAGLLCCVLHSDLLFATANLLPARDEAAAAAEACLDQVATAARRAKLTGARGVVNKRRKG